MNAVLTRGFRLRYYLANAPPNRHESWFVLIGKPTHRSVVPINRYTDFVGPTQSSRLSFHYLGNFESKARSAYWVEGLSIHLAVHQVHLLSLIETKDLQLFATVDERPRYVLQRP
jgi:hypothetical protein